jgi:hypothetical protein
MIVMEQTTMLAIFAIALALGVTTAMLVIPMIPQVYAPPSQQGSDNRQRACEHAGADHVPFCGHGGGGD